MKIASFAAAVAVSAATLVWIGYSAIAEWEHAATMVASRNAEAAADLLTSALARDMRGAQAAVLSSAERDDLTAAAEADLLHPVAGAFARYPYPEAFFWWRGTPTPESVVFYTRAERRPAWVAKRDERHGFPVVIVSEPKVASRVTARVMQDAWQARRFSIFETDLAGARYQIVTVLSYADPLREHAAAAFGFMVNLDWARRQYFQDIVAQVGSIEGRDRGVRFTVLDDTGAAVVGSGSRPRAPEARRVFPMTFFDPLMVAIDPPPDLRLASWTAMATAEGDPTLAVAERSARNTLALAAVMALTLAVAFILSLNAARASANLAEMRAEFVSAVTHELKTPVANMRAISETLASGRSTLEMSREYGQMGIREANRLSRLVDNLLAYSRVADVADVYSFEPVALHGVVEKTLQEFAPNLAHGGFEVHVDVPEDLPVVRADPTALGLMLNNLIDNAIRYSKDTRSLSIDGRPHDRTVTIRVVDRGIGIPDHEIAHVTRKFFRGRASHGGGSGLGLAIVDRIVADHGGSLAIDSAAGRGTAVSVTLPVA